MSLILSCEILAESDNTNPPTIARQVETEAIRPIMKLVAGVILPPIPRFNMPDFCKIKNKTRNARPMGRACQITPLFLFSLALFSTERV